MRADPVVVIGAGLTGLSCARRLHAAGVDVCVIESRSRVGGRVATDIVDGFRLDVGFQVLLTAYPEARAALDLDDLRLRAFRPGSLIRLGDRTTRIADPWRAPWHGVCSLFSPLMTARDALRAARLRSELMRVDRPFAGTGSDLLDRAGISGRLRRAFFEPFFAGVTLDPKLAVPADYFAFLFRMFARGDAALPAAGMGAIPAQLAARLPAGSVHLRCRARELGADFVVTDDGERVAASNVVLATDGGDARELTGDSDPLDWQATTTLYFAADRPPIEEPTLMLNGTGDGPVHHVSVPSVVQPSYAPVGQSLVSVSVLGVPSGTDQDLAASVRDQLSGWFGSAAVQWRWLRTYRIPHAQPRLPGDGPAMNRTGVAVRPDGLIVAGDHLATPSIQGAMQAGRRAAEAVLAGVAGALR